MMAVSLAIGAMLILAWAFRSQPAVTAPGMMPAIANASMAPAACPAGTVPRSMLRVLEPGPITDDTSPPPEPGPVIDDSPEQPG
jgi:hypothetical protein